MGYPVNPDGSFEYDRPLKTPATLTDPPAAYALPSEAAWGVALAEWEMGAQ